MPVCPCIVDEEIVPLLDPGKLPVHCEFITVLAQRAGYIIQIIAGLVLLAEHRNMMVRAVDCRTHQIRRAGVCSNIFFVNMFLMNCLRHQGAVRSHHIAAEFGTERHISHAGRNQYFLIDPAHAFSDHMNIVRLLIGTVRDSNTAGQVDERNMGSCFFF